jgi:eukaryotic-like serine/threonine-protein kinase
MSEKSARLWTSTQFRVFVSVFGVVIAAALILVGLHGSSTGGTTTTQTTSANAVQVPQLVGLPQSAAETLLKGEGLKYSVKIVPSSGAAGVILTQSPSPGASVAPGTEIVLTAANGAGLPVVPNVAGQTEAQAKATLFAVGFTVKDDTTVHSPTVANGLVISTNPAAGTPVPANSSIALTISTGPAKTTTTKAKTTGTTAKKTTTATTKAATHPTSPPTTSPPTTTPTTTPPTTTPTTTPPTTTTPTTTP